MKKFSVSVKEYSKNGKRYVKINNFVSVIDYNLDMGLLLFNLLSVDMSVFR